MSSLRLTFLYPHLFRSIRVSEPAVQTTRQCCRHSRPRRSMAFSTALRREQRFTERHGKAVEPFLAPNETREDVRVFVPESKPEPIKVESAENSNKPGSGTEKALNQKASAVMGAEDIEASSLAHPAEELGSAVQMPADSEKTDTIAKPVDPIDPVKTQSTLTTGGPLERAMNAEAVAMNSPDDLHIPHLHPPQHVHNFDTWTLVRDVEKGGFTADQAVTAMKAVRVLLAKNLEVAKEGLVSKSDVENETYLFRAACSELRTEIQNARRASEEQMRRERTQLQHEYDILNQKLTQELLILKDELTGMFNDRKMAVRMEQREMESEIQQLNYKITVALNSDSKSEVEGLRWVLTRRSVLAIVFMALMVLSSLRYASYRAHEQEVERKRLDKLRQADAEHRARNKDGEGMADGETQTDGDGPPDRRDLPAGTMAETLSAS